MISDKFWSSRISTVRENTLPSMHNILVETGRWDLMKLRVKPGSIPHHFWDSDIAKFLEALCYSLKYINRDDPIHDTFVGWINEATDMIINAQQPDGYINSYFTVVEPDKKFTNIVEMHELYCAGHLLEAAIAHFQTFKDSRLLDSLCKYMDLICTKFGPEDGKIHGYPGHPEIEYALARLLEIKWSNKYFDLLNYFIEQRGYNGGEFLDQQAWDRGVDPTKYIPRDPGGAGWWPEPRSYWYYQSESLIRETLEVKGHSVRQVYLLAGVQKLAAMKNDEGLKNSVNRLWRDMVDKKFYIHGGIGSVWEWEGFGEPYDLRWDCYSETCASISILFLGKTMLESGLNSEVCSVMERALFNNVLGGVSLDGKAYYYDQPITGTGGKTRQTWFTCCCCPPNVARLFNSLENYVITYFREKNMITVNLFIGGEFVDKDYKLNIISDYPHTGNIVLKPMTSKELAIAIVAPRDPFVVTGCDYVLKDNYIIFPSKVWTESDNIEITFEQEVRIISPASEVTTNAGCLAIEYGPFVYALEQSSIGSDKTELDTLTLPKQAKFEKRWTSLEGCSFWSLETVMGGVKCNLVPYFVTGNKNPGEDFRIWIKEDSCM
ncbi:glycoside hydrolase family 127 protein [[Candida] arabinofermentans NRRL YB-2248]|uniref:Glycoside hydrolase family 127 protein n=1 Tax=[Candida] arabinofermentans NRRL YB-2248 TaxID=983967 RepID=A0A1E4SWE8_9ASCO|nr:glycoside hydrolase family 127 protein [[Candida] arabinofermentans NRRL YB-2248]